MLFQFIYIGILSVYLGSILAFEVGSAVLGKTQLGLPGVSARIVRLELGVVQEVVALERLDRYFDGFVFLGGAVLGLLLARRILDVSLLKAK